MKQSYNIYENGHCFASVDAASARGALRVAARRYPRHACDYGTGCEYWETWRAVRPGVDGFEAEAQVLIPTSGTLRGAGRSVYRPYVLPDMRGDSSCSDE